MADIPVIDEYTWARITAKAYLDTSNFKSEFETDPAAAVSRARLENPEFNIPAAPVRLMDLSYSTGYSGPPDAVAMLLTAIFQGSTEARLKEVFNSGTFDGKPVEMPSCEWINPSGPIKLLSHNAGAISQKDWMRIYAYIWHQMLFVPHPPPPDTIRDRFEQNPAQTLANEIVGHLGIDYQPGKPLFTLGTPPEDPAQLTNIRGDPGARGYRHRVRLCAC
jgi:hypothetical protein